MGHTKHHMKAKHHRKAGGGATSMKDRDDYSGSGEPNVVKEAHELKHGGKVHGHKGKHRHHVKKARGGGIGADKSPFSSAGAGGMNAHPADHGHGQASHEGGKGGFTGGHGK